MAILKRRTMGERTKDLADVFDDYDRRIRYAKFLIDRWNYDGQRPEVDCAALLMEVHHALQGGVTADDFRVVDADDARFDAHMRHVERYRARLAELSIEDTGCFMDHADIWQETAEKGIEEIYGKLPGGETDAPVAATPDACGE